MRSRRRSSNDSGSMFPMPEEYVPAKDGAIGQPACEHAEIVHFPMPDEYVSADGRVGRRRIPRTRAAQRRYIQLFMIQNGQWTKIGSPQQMFEAQARQNIEQAVERDPQLAGKIGYVLSGPQGVPVSAPQWVYHCYARPLPAGGVSCRWEPFSPAEVPPPSPPRAESSPAPPPTEAAAAPAHPPGPSWQPPPTSNYSASWLVFVKQPHATNWERTSEVFRDAPFDKVKNRLFEQKALHYSADVIADSRCYAVAQLPRPPEPGEPHRPEPYSPTVFIGCGRRVRLPR